MSMIERRRALMAQSSQTKLSLFNFAESIDEILLKAGFQRFDVEATQGTGEKTVSHNLGFVPTTCFAILENVNYTKGSYYQAGYAGELTASSTQAGYTMDALDRNFTNTTLNNILAGVEPNIQWNVPLPNTGSYHFVLSVSDTVIVLRNYGGAHISMKTGNWRVYLR